MSALTISTEQALGHHTVRPGEVWWLPEADWHPGVISITRTGQVRLVSIRAKKPGTGSLVLLFGRCRGIGLRVIIVEPCPRLRASVERWGWKMQVVDDCETWSAS